ncbi:hypothetical protein [Bosea sp. 2RAB26]|uniref:hypothetical protein n=1 Tax=Bosea sp. 2RAB26 TaxID=3237476 RepID=UPI003F93B013
MQFIIAGIALHSVVEVVEGGVAAEEDVVALAARGHAAAITRRQCQPVVARLAEQVVKAARAAIENIVACPAMDFVVAAKAGDLPGGNW